jgi:SAM-dependent methyltransferase
VTVEVEHYDSEYADVTFEDPVDPIALGSLWTENPWAPFNSELLRLIGDLRGKTVLLLGNGVGLKELHLLAREPARLIYSDLSPAAVDAVRRQTESLGASNLELRPVDALEMPFADGEIDVVYGYAFAHHLPDLPRFLAETRRVLAPGGRAIFMDNAEVPLWQHLKTGLLRPLMRASRAINPISDADVQVSEVGWYSAEALESAVRDAGCTPFQHRSGLLHYLAVRVMQILQRPQRTWVDGRPRFRHARLLRALDRVDSQLARTRLFAANRIRLVWGFDVPR